MATQRPSTIYTHAYRQFSVASQPHVHVCRLWVQLEYLVISHVPQGLGVLHTSLCHSSKVITETFQLILAERQQHYRQHC